MTNENAYYVSNKRLFEEYVAWYAAIKEAEEEGIEEPQIPPYIVEAIMRISTRLSYKPNFINYSFKEDMISDARYDCIRFAKKFDPDKSDNPFSYLTTICFNAFLRRIDKEKAQKYIKSQLVASSPDYEFLDQQNEDDKQYVNQYVEFLREVSLSDECVPMSIKRTKKYKNIAITKGPLESVDE